MPIQSHAAKYRRPAPRVRVARWLLIGIVAATAGWLAYVDRLRVIGVGHIKAEEVILSSLFEGRIDALHVACNDRFAMGDVLAHISNPIRTHTYREELVALETDHHNRRIAHETRLAVASAQTDAAGRRLDAARRHAANMQALATVIDGAWRAGEADLKQRVSILNARERSREELASAESALRRAQAVQVRLQAEAEAQLAGFAERLEAQRRLVAFAGREPLVAPFSGTVTECPRSVGDVVRPSITVLRVQRDDSARILIWVSAVDLPRLALGMPAEVFLADSQRSVAGRVSALADRVGALPSSLKRYFWQNQAWQQYALVEVKPDDPSSVRALPGDARVDAVIRLSPKVRLPRTVVQTL
ncbi:HlyD family efflux transporter periplasmic adaptor subunit [Azospirillum sp. RWY-5-1]|uniref:HlyD family efflux transporter periplasmic adaptor subunit n=1 Tax=Azospirillum oleiclasticum TaxID=2735135 RepID=A0ABX2TFN2_9PROT|nr:HlyD family efflux transporter periplasmic adaptor subunit [Azospirillum oleiclasticum]NYZ14504.1 HlyD family efflux transporter periplasmic adaptor subunit [Azospirillum oleiclasticum]NYZ23144.1 HlyD family efflux transporter periplasmic adaptor subunit [Azospirillum oleiclasticum]